MPRKAPTVQKERLHLLVSPKTKTLIETVQERIDARDMTDVVREAINLLDLVSERVSEGYDLVWRRDEPNGEEVLQALPWRSVVRIEP